MPLFRAVSGAISSELALPFLRFPLWRDLHVCERVYHQHSFWQSGARLQCHAHNARHPIKLCQIVPVEN